MMRVRYFLFDGKWKIRIPTEEDIQEMTDLVSNIGNSIKRNFDEENIMGSDAVALDNIASELYNHIMAMYEEKGGERIMLTCMPGVLELPQDDIIDRMSKLEKTNENTLKERDEALAQLAQQNAQLEKQNAQLADLKVRMAEMERELEDLKNSAAG